MAEVIEMKDKSTRGARTLEIDSLIGTRKQFTDTYYVRTVSLSETEDDVMAATGLPSLRSLSDGAYLKKKTAKEVNASALLWEVECIYDSSLESEEKAVRWYWTAETKEEVIKHDQITGDPIVDAAGTPLIMTAPFSYPVLNIIRIENPVSGWLYLMYSNRTNYKKFWGWPRGTVLLKGPTTTPVTVNTLDKEKVHYRFVFNPYINPNTREPEGWKAYLLNRGPNCRLVPYGKVVDRCKGNNFHIEANLDVDGTQLDADEDVNYLSFSKYKEANFNALALGPW